jgi:hypothetical protein
MARLATPRPWYILGGLLMVLGILVLDGAAGGLVLAVAAVVLLVGIFISLRRDKPDERVSRSGIIGGL